MSWLRVSRGSLIRRVMTLGNAVMSSSSSLSIQRGRLLDTIHDTANRFGAEGRWGPEINQTGVCRLALSDEDKKVKDWFIQQCQDLGCKIDIDKMGNIFSLYPGIHDGKPTAIGSHLDTQPTGGRYDGIYGVLSGLEILRTLNDNHVKPNYPICLVNWMNEEGARFPMSMMASSVWAGQAKIDDVYKIKSVNDDLTVTVEDELKRIGYVGSIESSSEAYPLAAHFEIHIEQGPVLENKNKKIGLVKGIQALTWNKLKIVGKAQHTGTTPLNARSDPLLAMAEMIVSGNKIATKHGGLFSIGVLELKPAVANVIPSEIEAVIDTRHEDQNILKQMNAEINDDLKEIVARVGRKFSVHMDNLVDQPSVVFDHDCRQTIAEAAVEEMGNDNVLEIVSGAYHDSGPVSGRCPTAMIFIPSRDGVSHNPEEYSTPEQIDDGFRVLLNAVLRYDKKRTH